MELNRSTGGANPWVKWVRRRSAPKSRARALDKLTIVDLFSGCGGMTLGLREAARINGFTCDIKLAVDFNKAAIDVYRKNFSLDEKVARCADISQVVTGEVGDQFDSLMQDLIAEVGDLDVLVAGPPCQGHSDLNNHSRRNDPRNNYYLTVVRAVEAFRPNIVIIENVATVVHDEGGVANKANNFLREFGYGTHQAVVEMVHFGVPQKRRRHVTVAVKNRSSDEVERLICFNRTGLGTVRDFIGDLESEGAAGEVPFRSSSKTSKPNLDRIAWLFENDAFDLPDSLRPPCHRDKAHSYRSMYGRMHWDLPAQTITTGFGSMGQGRYVHPSKQRTITCHEAARLQGFPDFFRFDSCNSLTALREMIGNAVPPPFMAGLAFGLLSDRRSDGFGS